MTITHTETITVEDEDGLNALPIGTIIEDEDEDLYRKYEDGWHDWFPDDADKDGGITPLNPLDYTPLVVVNPEVLGTFEAQRPFAIGDPVVVVGAHYLHNNADFIYSGECERGDTGTVLDYRYDGGAVQVRWHGTGRRSVIATDSLDLFIGARDDLLAGDKVNHRTVGGVGTIVRFLQVEDDFNNVLVSWSDGRTVPAFIGNLTKVEPVVEPEPLADWERELLALAPVIEVGDTVRLVDNTGYQHVPAGALAEVVQVRKSFEKMLDLNFEEGYYTGGMFARRFELVEKKADREQRIEAERIEAQRQADIEAQHAAIEALRKKLMTPVIEAGDIVKIVDGVEYAAFAGLVCQVVKVPSEGIYEDSLWVKPLADRPDPHGRSPFFWNKDEFALVAKGTDLSQAEPKVVEVQVEAKVESTYVNDDAGLDALPEGSLILALNDEGEPVGWTPRYKKFLGRNGTGWGWASFNEWEDEDTRSLVRRNGALVVHDSRFFG